MLWYIMIYYLSKVLWEGFQPEVLRTLFERTSWPFLSPGQLRDMRGLVRSRLCTKWSAKGRGLFSWRWDTGNHWKPQDGKIEDIEAPELYTRNTNKHQSFGTTHRFLKLVWVSHSFTLLLHLRCQWPREARWLGSLDLELAQLAAKAVSPALGQRFRQLIPSHPEGTGEKRQLRPLPPQSISAYPRWFWITWVSAK